MTKELISILRTSKISSSISRWSSSHLLSPRRVKPTTIIMRPSASYTVRSWPVIKWSRACSDHRLSRRPWFHRKAIYKSKSESSRGLSSFAWRKRWSNQHRPPPCPAALSYKRMETEEGTIVKRLWFSIHKAVGRRRSSKMSFSSHCIFDCRALLSRSKPRRAWNRRMVAMQKYWDTSWLTTTSPAKTTIQTQVLVS